MRFNWDLRTPNGRRNWLVMPVVLLVRLPLAFIALAVIHAGEVLGDLVDRLPGLERPDDYY